MPADLYDTLMHFRTRHNYTVTIALVATPTCTTSGLDSWLFFRLYQWWLQVEEQGVSLQQRDAWDATPLYYASYTGNEKLVALLLSKGATCEEKVRFTLPTCEPYLSASQYDVQEALCADRCCTPCRHLTASAACTAP